MKSLSGRRLKEIKRLLRKANSGDIHGGYTDSHKLSYYGLPELVAEVERLQNIIKKTGPQRRKGGNKRI